MMESEYGKVITGTLIGLTGDHRCLDYLPTRRINTKISLLRNSILLLSFLYFLDTRVS